MADGYCERQDVLDVLEEASLSGAYSQRPAIVDTAITGLTEYLRDETGRHWYDSSGTEEDLIPTAAVSATEMRHDVPSSPHRQDRQLFAHHQGARYPVSTNGPYVRIPLDHHGVTSVTALRVRDSSGEFNDWVADSDIVQGRGEDYYLSTPTDAGSGGRTRLYLHEGTLPCVVDYDGMLLLDYDYGRDGIPDTVNRMTALLAASQLVTADEFVTAIPDSGQLVNVETKAQRWERQGEMLLDNYRSVEVA